MNSLVFVLLAGVAVATAQSFAQQQQLQQGPALVPTTRDGSASILSHNSQLQPNGNYQYAYKTENGLYQQESNTRTAAAVPVQRTADDPFDGLANNVNGQYSYTGPDGVVYTINYVADENGYRASGAHLPVAPAVPAEIQRSLGSQSQFQPGFQA